MSEQALSNHDRLAGYVEVWWQAIHDFSTLLERLAPTEWSAPTDLTGWDVHAVAAHIAHLESVLAGAPEETVDVGQPPHVKGRLGLYAEQGVVARRERSADELITEIRAAATARHTALLAAPLPDASAPAPGPFGALGWNWNTLLRNRPLDVWMHEQDIRRAVDLPGNLDSPAARHTADYLAESLGLVLAKRVGAPAGTTLVLDMAGHEPVGFVVNEAGRGERLPACPPEAGVRLTCDREAFVLLAGGRRAPKDGSMVIAGDTRLGTQVLESMAVTP